MAIDPQKTNSAFLDLPSNIKSWLASEELAYTISEINNRVGLQGEKRSIIPGLVLRLTVQDLEPLNFIDELSKELGVNFEVAKTIAKDIESRALRPVENELKKNLGLDVKVIYFGKPGGKPPQETAPIEKQEKKGEPKDSEIYIPKEPAPALTQETSKTESKVNLKTFEEISPFMLHQEKTDFRQRPFSEIGPRINIKTPTEENKEKEEPGPTTVELESQASPNNKTRVVHYHQFKTPVNNLGLPKKDQS